MSENLKSFKVKFFGSKDRKEQIKQVKTVILAENREKVEDVLRHKFLYKVINGLKISECNENEY